YDAASERAPYDVAQHRARCEFIDQFASSYEYVSFVDELYAMAESCREKLKERFPNHPEVQLDELDQMTAAEQLAWLNAHGVGADWTHGQTARLYEKLARAADESKQGKQAIEFARYALRNDERANVREILARHLLADGNKDEAIEVLTSPVESLA